MSEEGTTEASAFGAVLGAVATAAVGAMFVLTSSSTILESVGYLLVVVAASVVLGVVRASG